ncbi:hypothetical protein ABNX05_05975 [Lysinibacillus sp. M3]|uniref:Uncharacterized protein n=1 Tax=Lysinibacillus zambalensis TaxID=3160866 RepID=A0ABV1MQH1_9BACI
MDRIARVTERRVEATDKTARVTERTVETTERTVETTESTPKSKQKSTLQYGDDLYFHAILVILRWAVMVE